LGNSEQNFTQLTGDVDLYVILFGVVCLSWCDFAMDLTKEHHQILCRSGKSATESMAVIRQAFREGTISHTRKVQTHRDRKRRDRWRTKSRACSSFSLTLRGSFTKNSAWHAKQWISRTTMPFYGDCVKMWEDFAPNFGGKGSGSYITTTHRHALPFSLGDFLTKNNITVVPHPPYFFLFPRLKLILKGRHFNTTEVIEAESQAVLKRTHRTRLPGCI
jgi:hypothetical protein